MFLSGGCGVQHHTSRDSWGISSTHVLYSCIDLGPNCRGPWTGSNPSWPWSGNLWNTLSQTIAQRQKSLWKSRFPVKFLLIVFKKEAYVSPVPHWSLRSVSLLSASNLWSLLQWWPILSTKMFKLKLVFPVWFLLPLLHPVSTWVLLIPLPKYFLYLSAVFHLLS